MQRETITTNSSSIYEPVQVHGRSISLARANAERVILLGDKLSISNYPDWKATVYNHLMRLGIETLLAVPPNSGNQNEIALDRRFGS